MKRKTCEECGGKIVEKKYLMKQHQKKLTVEQKRKAYGD